MNKNSLDVYDVPSPKIKPGMILIKNVASIISLGTEGMVTSFGNKNLVQKAKSRPDLVKQVLDKVKTDGLIQTFNTATSNLDQPIALGYSCAGIVSEIPDGIYDINVGDRVACAGGGYAVHAEQIVVPRNLIVKIPNSVEFEKAAFSTIGSIAMQGIRLANAQIGESIAVIGLGLIGLLTVQILKAAGCKIIAYDPKNTQCALAKEMGINQATDDIEIFFQKCNMTSNNNGVDKVLITASTKSDKPIETAGIIARNKAKIVSVGAVGLNIPRKLYYEKELEFVVSKSYGPGRYDTSYEEGGQDYPIGYVRWTENRNMQAFLDLVNADKIDFEKIITHRFPIEKANDAYQLINTQSEENPIGIVIEYSIDSPETKKVEIFHKKRSLIKSGAFPKLGMIGAGGFASNVLIPIISKTKAEMIGLCNNSSYSAHHKAKKFGFNYCTTDVNEIIKDDEINTVVIATRHNSHAELVIRVLESGKNVFVEKPLALTLGELDMIVAKYTELKEDAPILLVGFNRRFSPLSLKMKTLIEKQASPVSIIVTINVGHISADHWTQNPTIGGGRIKGEACHFIDLIRFLVGKPIVSWSSNLLGKNVTKDTVTLSFLFEDRSIGTIHYFANGSKNFPKERVEVFCNNGILQLDNFRKLKGFGWPGFKSKKLFKQDKGHYNEIQSFLESIKSNSNQPIPFDEIMEVSRTTIEIADAL